MIIDILLQSLIELRSELWFLCAHTIHQRVKVDILTHIEPLRGGQRLPIRLGFAAVERLGGGLGMLQSNRLPEARYTRLEGSESQLVWYTFMILRDTVMIPRDTM